MSDGTGRYVKGVEVIVGSTFNDHIAGAGARGTFAIAIGGNKGDAIVEGKGRTSGCTRVSLKLSIPGDQLVIAQHSIGGGKVLTAS